ncbi:MAG: DUF177 domain-containing protein [Bacteroidales bacterium]|nr:DUF177 domain-containing protein [Bacteroidales bacterium]
MQFANLKGVVDSQYIIQFHGLKDGVHRFDFKAGNDFFKSFENPEVQMGDLNISADLEKRPQMLALSLKIKGTVKVVCDRCLDIVDLKVKGETQLFFKFGDQDEEMTHELIVLSHNSHEIDIAGYIYETTILSLPYKKVHPKNSCNPDMITRIEGFDDDYIANEKTDPRWDKLKDIIINN